MADYPKEISKLPFAELLEFQFLVLLVLLWYGLDAGSKNERYHRLLHELYQVLVELLLFLARINQVDFMDYLNALRLRHFLLVFNIFLGEKACQQNRRRRAFLTDFNTLAFG